MTQEFIFQFYQDLFNEYESSELLKPYIKLGFGFQFDADEVGSDILFIGLNPSLKDDIEFSIDCYKKNSDYRYFKSFQSICTKLEEKYELTALWTHIDLLAIRETKQEVVESISKGKFIDDNKIKHKDERGISFIYEQVMFAKKRILHIKPKVIVVCNAQAREFMGKNRGIHLKTNIEYGIWMNFSFEWNNEFGCHTIKDTPELKHTHVLFSSMLSGQRALDLGSRERLTWQIARLLKCKP